MQNKVIAYLSRYYPDKKTNSVIFMFFWTIFWAVGAYVIQRYLFFFKDSNSSLHFAYSGTISLFLEVKALQTAKKLKVKHGTLENLGDQMILIKDLESA